jgi:hypothetical protein
MKFKIKVTRTTHRETILEIEDDSESSAFNQASSIASNTDFNEFSSSEADYDYELVSVEKSATEDLFDLLYSAFAVAVENRLSSVTYYEPEDRTGDTTQPLVELLDGSLCFEPSTVTEVKFEGNIAKVYLKDNGSSNPYMIQFLEVSELGDD